MTRSRKIRTERALPSGCVEAIEEWQTCRTSPSLGADGISSVADAVRAYIRHNRQRARAELTFYAMLPSLKEAVARAGRGERPDGKRHDHQRRIRTVALRKVGARLSDLSYRTCRDFEELHTLVESAIGDIDGIGELMVYDTALRIGAKLALEPKDVYLHAGTRAGARALGLQQADGQLAMDQLPRALRRLSPREAEDCLCIYKDFLSAAPT